MPDERRSGGLFAGRRVRLYALFDPRGHANRSGMLLPIFARCVGTLKERALVRREWLVRRGNGSLLSLNVRARRLTGGRFLVDFRHPFKKALQHLEWQPVDALVQSMPDPMWLKNPDGLYIACNSAFERLVAASRRHILGRSEDDLRLANQTGNYMDLDRRTTEFRETTSFTRHYRSLDGAAGYFRVTKAPFFGGSGELLGVLGWARDMNGEYRAREAARTSEDRFRILFDSVSDALFVTDLEARIVDVNQRACDMLGYTRGELVNMSVMDIEIAISREKIVNEINAGLSRCPVTVFGCHRKKDGGIIPVEVSVNRFESTGEVGIIAIVRDITERQRVEDALRVSEEFNRAVLNASVSQIAVLNAAGVIVATNEAWRDFARENSQSPMQEARTGVGVNFLDVCRNSDSHFGQAGDALVGVSSVLQGRLSRFSQECSCKTAERELWFLMEATPLKQGGGGAVVAYLDITNIKKIQELQDRLTRQFKALAKKEQDILEEERHRLSMELHDHVGQTLAVLQMLLFDGSSRLADRPEIRALADKAMHIVDGLVESIRDISRRLRPLVLDDLGLVSAIRWHINQLPLPSEVRVLFEAEIGKARFPAAIELACFRIVQEAVSNALRHAQASKIVVSLFFGWSQVCLNVHDNGRGFDSEKSHQNAENLLSLGLIGMQERVAGLGGRFDVISGPGQGTDILACFPLDDPR